MIGGLATQGQLFGLLQLGGSMLDLIGPMTVLRGDDMALVLTVTDDEDARVDLTGATIELEVKPELGGADPASIALAIGTGITLLDQLDADTKGQAAIAIASEATDITPGLYWLDVVVIPVAGGRTHVIAPREFTVAATVNAP